MRRQKLGNEDAEGGGGKGDRGRPPWMKRPKQGCCRLGQLGKMEVTP